MMDAPLAIVVSAESTHDACGPAEVLSQAKRKWPSSYAIGLVGRQGDSSSGQRPDP